MTQSTDHTSRVCGVLIDNFDKSAERSSALLESCSSITTHSRYTYHQASVVGVVTSSLSSSLSSSSSHLLKILYIGISKTITDDCTKQAQLSQKAAQCSISLKSLLSLKITEGQSNLHCWVVCFKFLLVFQCNYMSFLLLLRYFQKKFNIKWWCALEI